MAKAIDFAKAALKYIGTPYKELDCQGFVEKALRDVGVYKDWKGSNAMYRDMRVCEPVEEFIRMYGKIPVGALLFIWANDGGERERGYTDGLGNASHVGIYTGDLTPPGIDKVKKTVNGLYYINGKQAMEFVKDSGAVHSSSSRGVVCMSNFKNKSITGGWNYVGLTSLLEYDSDIEQDIKETEDMDVEQIMETGVIKSANGKSVNFRHEPSKHSGAYASLPVGTEVFVIEPTADGAWYRVKNNGKTGYIMQEFVDVMEEIEEAPDEPNQTEDGPTGGLEDRVNWLVEHVQRLEREWENKMGWG